MRLYRYVLIIIIFIPSILVMPFDAYPAQFNITSSKFNDPLVDAADDGNLQKVIYLLKSGYNVDKKGDFGVTPLMRASYKGHAEVVKLLLSIGADVDIKDIGGATALHLAARQANPEIVELLIQDGAKIDAVDNDGWTPLMRSILTKNKHNSAILLKNGANPLTKNNFGKTALNYIIDTKATEIFGILINNNYIDALPENTKFELIEYAINKNNDIYADKIMERMNLAKTDKVLEAKVEEKAKPKAHIEVAKAIKVDRKEEDDTNIVMQSAQKIDEPKKKESQAKKELTFSDLFGFLNKSKALEPKKDEQKIDNTQYDNNKDYSVEIKSPTRINYHLIYPLIKDNGSNVAKIKEKKDGSGYIVTIEPIKPYDKAAELCEAVNQKICSIIIY